MKIACLQFAPRVGEIEHNIARAEGILGTALPLELDLLVLPELAFSGYNFSSLREIQPYLEPSSTGVSTQWAIRTAKRLNCIVTIGYPERCIPESTDPTTLAAASLPPVGDRTTKNYNASVTVSPKGEILAHYRKSFLYYTDETWASEGDGFYAGSFGENVNETVAIGICMDINPYKFATPWQKYEFASHVVTSGAGLVVLSMAWLTSGLTTNGLQVDALQPDMSTLSYWVERFQPLMNSEHEVVLVMGNRSGVEGTALYAGTSTVMRVSAGVVSLWDILGRGEERCLVVDTKSPPKFVFYTDPRKA